MPPPQSIRPCKEGKVHFSTHTRWWWGKGQPSPRDSTSERQEPHTAFPTALEVQGPVCVDEQTCTRKVRQGEVGSGKLLHARWGKGGQPSHISTPRHRQELAWHSTCNARCAWASRPAPGSPSPTGTGCPCSRAPPRACSQPSCEEALFTHTPVLPCSAACRTNATLLAECSGNSLSGREEATSGREDGAVQCIQSSS